MFYRHYFSAMYILITEIAYTSVVTSSIAQLPEIQNCAQHCTFEINYINSTKSLTLPIIIMTDRYYKRMKESTRCIYPVAILRPQFTDY